MTAQEVPGNRLVIVSNRLPIVLKQEGGSWQVSKGSGGLVTALAPVLRDRGGLWIGWPGIVEGDADLNLEQLMDNATQDSGYLLRPVILTAEERDNFYYGFANEVIWPIFHDLQTMCNFNPGYWKAYQQVNRKFATEIARHSRPDDYVWVHDYHLMNVAQELRELGIHSAVGFYTHIPFPPLDMFLKLPWRLEILRALLQYDLIGVQTIRDLRNLLQCVEKIIPDARIEGNGQVASVLFDGREIRVGSFPISIDFKEFSTLAHSQEVGEEAWYIHENFPNRKIILGVDRLDYTKGIPYRLDAYRRALECYPELHEKISLIQIVVPSRQDIPEYQELKTEIEQSVGEINGEFTRGDWLPVQYIFRSLERRELLAYYRTAEIALVTPLKDGMNLIAKEYCASKVDNNGILILSEFAGAASQLQDGAILVNPYHIEGMAEAIRRAFYMPEQERKQRMEILRAVIRDQDIFWWVDSFLRAAISKDLAHFPLQKDYVPQIEVE
ncbi:MAG: alpha,alpha-trehalose-phosphate synthase (UDP-forming) [Acidobacteriota bacterium]